MTFSFIPDCRTYTSLLNTVLLARKGSIQWAIAVTYQTTWKLRGKQKYFPKLGLGARDIMLQCWAWSKLRQHVFKLHARISLLQLVMKVTQFEIWPDRIAFL